MPPSKTTRFEVFKRDNFTCQYCGRVPSVVALELDHINPKSNGGVEDINNYITSCYDCNRGKGSRLLDNKSPNIATVIKSAQEKQEQLDAYKSLIKEQEQRYFNLIRAVRRIYHNTYPEWTFNKKFHPSIRRFAQFIPDNKVKEAMEIACCRCNGADRALSYFCGICWNWIKQPETRDW